MADDTKQTKAHDLLRRTFGNTTPMQSDERMMQAENEPSINPALMQVKDYAEHLEGRPLSLDEIQPAQQYSAQTPTAQSMRSQTPPSSET